VASHDVDWSIRMAQTSQLADSEFLKIASSDYLLHILPKIFLQVAYTVKSNRHDSAWKTYRLFSFLKQFTRQLTKSKEEKYSNATFSEYFSIFQDAKQTMGRQYGATEKNTAVQI